MNFNHISVLLKECLDGLNINPNGVYIDATLGGGGHSLEICRKLSPKGKLIGIDQDINAINKAKEVLKDFNNVIYINDNFSNINQIIPKLQSMNITKINGALFDLGVSSHQLDEGSRGFSYMAEGALDMRMDNRNELSAYDIVNNYSTADLSRIISEYGEERWSKRIAEFIVSERKNKPIETTFELVSVIKKAIPAKARFDGPHPAKRTFQAIRIEVNQELNILSQAIEDITEYLTVGGRLCIISFHSLEDRIVKNTFKKMENPCTCPLDFNVCVCNKEKKVSIITKRPISPSEVELENNHRARSAKLRIAERI